MKKTSLILIFIFALGAGYHADAQVGNYLKKKAKQAATRSGEKADEEVTEEMNKKVDKEVEKVFDKLFSEDENASSESKPLSDDTGNVSNENLNNSSTGKDDSDARAKSMLKAFGISTAPANVKDNYHYSGSIRMEVQSWKGNGETDGSMDYYTYIDKNNTGFAMKFTQPGKGNSLMIFDYENEAMIILSEENGEKTGIVTNYAGMSAELENDEDMEQDPEEHDYDPTMYNENLKKTGRSKTISGYKCDEYVYEDDENKTNMWMTKDLSPDLWSKMIGANVMTAGNFGFYGGFVMELDQKEKNSGDRTYMVVKEVNQNSPTSISTQSYNLMSIGVNTEEIE